MNNSTNPHLVDGKYGIRDLVNLDELRRIFERFTEATGFTIGFLDHPDLNILIATGWKDICTKFHRGCPASQAACLESNHHLLNNLNEPGKLVVERCGNGLVDCAFPIIVKGKHIASLATGQLLLEQPDRERFRRQAAEFGFDETAYMAALDEVSVVPEDKLRSVTKFLGELAMVLSRLGYANLLVKEDADRLRQSEEGLLEAERARRASEERMQLAMELLDTGEWELNLDDHTAHRSVRHDRLFGYEKLLPEWTYEMFLGHVLPEDRDMVGQKFQAALAAHTDWNFECRIRRYDGVVRWIHAAGRHCPGTNGKLNRLVGFVRDITVRKQAEDERRQIENKLLETQKLESLGILAGGIAHDFNNLLTGVMGNASMIRAQISDTSPTMQFLDQIEAAAMQAADLCKQMLAYAGKGRYVVQKIDLSSLVKETISLLQSSVGKDVVMKYHLGADLPATNADASQLRQIVMNLVINASEAIGGKSGLVTVTTGFQHADKHYLATAKLAAELPEGDYVFLEISDTGCGMSPETITKIFDPFFTTKFTGRGLGLAAVLGIVRGHHGALKVYSEVGKGTTFKVLLPCKQERLEPPAVTKSAAAAWSGSGTILVIDDEQIVRSTASVMLELIGFTVLQARDGCEGLEKFIAHAGEIRAVLLDLTMPNLDGEGTFRELRLLRPEVRVLLMSGFNEQEAINRFTGKGIAGFLQKPFKLESLREKMREILA